MESVVEVRLPVPD